MDDVDEEDRSCDFVWHWYCLSSSAHKLLVGMNILWVRMKSDGRLN